MGDYQLDCDYPQVMLVVIVELKDDIQKYYNLFKTLLGVEVLKSRRSKDYAEIISEKFNIRFTVKTILIRGWKAHYVLNLTQDEEYNNYFAEPMTVIHSMLDRTIWKELFE